MKFKNLKLSGKLLTVFISILVFLTVVILIVNYNIQKKFGENILNSNIERTQKVINIYLTTLSTRATVNLNFLQNNSMISNSLMEGSLTNDYTELVKYFWGNAAEQNQGLFKSLDINFLMILDAKKNIILSSEEQSKINLGVLDLEELKNLENNQNINAITNIIKINDKIILASLGKIASNNQMVGYIIIGIKIDKELTTQIKDISMTEIIFMNEKTIFGSTLENVNEIFLKDKFIAETIINNRTKKLDKIDIFDKSYSAMIFPLQTKKDEKNFLAYVICLDKRAEVDNQVKNSILYIIIINLIISIISIIIIFFIIKSIIKPLNKIMNISQKIAEGDLKQEKLIIESKDEIGLLADVFNQMLVSLNKLVRQAETIAQDDLKNNILDEKVTGDLGNTFFVMTNKLRDFAQIAELIGQDKIFDEKIDKFISITDSEAINEKGIQEFNKTNIINKEQSNNVGVLMVSFRNMIHILRQIAKQADLIASDDLYNKELDKEVSQGALGGAFSKMRVQLRALAKQADLIAKDDLYNKELDKEVSQGALGGAFNQMRVQLRALAKQAELIAKDDLYNELLSEKGTGALSSAFAEMVKKLRNFAKLSGEIANGNLLVTMEPGSEKGTLGGNFKKMLDSLIGLIKLLKNLSGRVDEVSEEMLSSSTQMSRGLSNQYNKVQEMSSAMEEMSTSIQQIKENVKHTTDRAKETVESVREGRGVINSTVQGLTTIKEAVDNTANSMEKLADRSKEITKILKAITEISEQTNLLALNAAIEAARAGEYGKGFAVVADEVRKLAERSARNALEIGGIVERIQEDITHSVEAMMNGKVYADEGEKSVGNLESAFSKIEDMINSTTRAVNEISVIITQQVKTTVEISNSMESVTTISKQSATGSQGVVEVSKNLKSVVQDLNSNIAKFKI